MSLEEFFSQYPSAPGVWQVGSKLYLATAKAAAEGAARKAGITAVWVTPQPAAASAPKAQKQKPDGTE